MHTHTHIHIYTYTHMHTYKHIHIHTHIHAHTYTHAHIHTYTIHTHIHAHTYTHTHTHTHARTHTQGEVFSGKKKSPEAAADYTNEIRITVQSSGKTSTSGCLDRDMLLEACTLTVTTPSSFLTVSGLRHQPSLFSRAYNP
jgi:hypothetical protein